MSQVSIVDVVGNNPQIPTRFVTNFGIAIPIGNTLEILGTAAPAGTDPVFTTGSGNTVTVNVQIAQAIVASNALNVGLAAFNSDDFIVDANGFVSLDGADFDGLTPDDGGQVTAVAGNINVFGQKAGVVPVVETHNVANVFTIEDRTWQTQYVVDASTTVGLQGTYTTVQAAINQAVLDGASLTVQKMISVRYGTYVEDLDIPPGIFIKGEAMVSQPGAVPLYTEIRGNHTLQATNLFRTEHIYWTNVSPTADMFSPNAINIVNAANCVFNNGNSTGYIFTLDYNFQQFMTCIFYANPFQAVFNMTGGQADFIQCSFPQNNGFDNTSNLRFVDCKSVGPIVNSDGSVIAYETSFNGGTNCISGNGSSLALFNCQFNSSSDSISYTGLVYFTGCSLSSGGNNQNLYALGQLISNIPTLMGNIIPHTDSNINISADAEMMIYVDSTSGPITVTLPYDFTIDKIYLIKDITGTSASNNITIEVGTPGGTIDGAASLVLNRAYQCVCVQYTGTAGEWISIWNSAGESITFTGNSGGALSPITNLNIFGTATSAGTTPVATSGAGTTLTVNVQRSQAIASTNATNVGLAAFNSTDFTVDVNGFVSLTHPSCICAEITGDMTLAVNTCYRTNFAGIANLTLPATAALCDTIEINFGLQGIPNVVQNAGQQIRVGALTSTVGVTGGITATSSGDCIKLKCVVAGTNTLWTAISSMGNWTVY